MLNYTQLEALATVLKTGSFEAAAAQLHITQSAVSQRVRHLEEQVGAPLVLRGQPCTGTQAGLRLAQHQAEVALLEARITGQAHTSPPQLRIAVNADSLATWALHAFAQHSSIQFDIVVDDQDHSAEWLKRGEVSAAVTATPKPPQGCESIPLGDMYYTAVASPDFVSQRFPNGVDKSSIEAAPMMVFNRKDRLQHTWQKKKFGVIHNSHIQVIPSTQGFIDAALLSMGWGLNPQALVEPFLADGRLVRLVEGSDMPVSLYWQHSRLLKEALTPVTRSIIEVSKKLLTPCA